MRVHICTYNIHGMPWCPDFASSILLWLFCQTPAEIVCFQEVFRESQRTSIRKACRGTHGKWTAVFPEDPCWIGSILPGLDSSSGLAICYKTPWRPVGQPLHGVFSERRGWDGWIRKGWFGLQLQNQDYRLTVVNTHFQSDFTELPYFRYRYNWVRDSQEQELYEACCQMERPVVLGDFNQAEFEHFEKSFDDYRPTFPTTQEHLDHLLFVAHKKEGLEVKHIEFYDFVSWSDHIPVLFTLDLKGAA